jgi:hypothetical protein
MKRVVTENMHVFDRTHFDTDEGAQRGVDGTTGWAETDAGENLTFRHSGGAFEPESVRRHVPGCGLNENETSTLVL